jgi:hypothetical protein
MKQQVLSLKVKMLVRMTMLTGVCFTEQVTSELEQSGMQIRAI